MRQTDGRAVEHWKDSEVEGEMELERLGLFTVALFRTLFHALFDNAMGFTSGLVYYLNQQHKKGGKPKEHKFLCSMNRIGAKREAKRAPKRATVNTLA